MFLKLLKLPAFESCHVKALFIRINILKTIPCIGKGVFLNPCLHNRYNDRIPARERPVIR